MDLQQLGSAQRTAEDEGWFPVPEQHLVGAAARAIGSCHCPHNPFSISQDWWCFWIMLPIRCIELCIKEMLFSSFFHSKAVSNRPCKVIFYNYLFEEFKFKIKNEIRIIMPVNQDNSPCLASSMKLTTSAKAAGWLCAQSARRSPAFIPYIHAWYVRTVYATSSLLKRASGW